MTRALVATMTLLLVASCGGTPPARLKTSPKDIYGQIAARAAQAPCAEQTWLTVPKSPSPSRSEGEFGIDVLFYFAHPEDETLYAPGTLEALARAQRRVFTAFLTHGEGGRLVERSGDGHIRERTGAPPAQVAEVRDREIARVMKVLGIPYEHLYPASVNGDFAEKDVTGLGRAAHACVDAYERWDERLPDGLAGLLRKLVADIRTRRPRVIVTHDPRDDDDFLDHAHHKALGALVDIAARAAAAPNVPGIAPHVVDELVSIAPKQIAPDITLNVGNEARKRLMTEHVSQFDTQKLADVAQRTAERYVVRWRAQGLRQAPGGSALVQLAGLK